MMWFEMRNPLVKADCNDPRRIAINEVPPVRPDDGPPSSSTKVFMSVKDVGTAEMECIGLDCRGFLWQSDGGIFRSTDLNNAIDQDTFAGQAGEVEEGKNGIQILRTSYVKDA